MTRPLSFFGCCGIQIWYIDEAPTTPLLPPALKYGDKHPPFAGPYIGTKTVRRSNKPVDVKCCFPETTVSYGMAQILVFSSPEIEATWLPELEQMPQYIKHPDTGYWYGHQTGKNFNLDRMLANKNPDVKLEGDPVVAPSGLTWNFDAETNRKNGIGPGYPTLDMSVIYGFVSERRYEQNYWNGKRDIKYYEKDWDKKEGDAVSEHLFLDLASGQIPQWYDEVVAHGYTPLLTFVNGNHGTNNVLFYKRKKAA